MEVQELITKKFNTYQDFELFENNLAKLLNRDELKDIGESNYKQYHFYRYETSDKKEVYCLSVPENAWRGFFLPYNLAKLHVDNIIKRNKVKSRGCIFFLLIIFTIALTGILFKNIFN